MLIVLAVLVAAVGGLALWQRHNLKSLVTAATSDTQALEENMVQVREEHQAALAEQNITITPPSLEQTQALLNGEVSAQDILDQLGISGGGQTQETGGSEEASVSDSSPAADQTGESAPGGQTAAQTESPAQSAADQPSGTQAGGTQQVGGTQQTGDAQQTNDGQQAEDAQQTDDTQQTAAQALVEQCVTELYALEVDLMSQLGGLKQAAVEEWRSLPDEERTTARKTAIGMNGLNQCYALESAADAQVQGVLARYRTQLEAIDADTSCIDQLWQFYQEEKASMKAYYLDQYL